jgi:hypothetical protein
VADLHIEEFYQDLAKILLQLHSYFPRKSQVYVEDISGPDYPDEYGLHSARHQSCFSAMLWLAEEGFIRFEDTIRQEAIDQAVLTQKTFIRLNKLSGLPNPAQHSNRHDAEGHSASKALTSSEPLSNIQLIRHTLKTATSTQLANVLEKILFNN